MLHPGLYRYNTPAGMAARIDALEREFTSAPDLTTRYLSLSRFLATIRCGHSYCNFFNQNKVVAAALFDNPTRLPFHFRWISGRMIVVDHGDDGLPRGTEILRLNGVAPREMLARLMPYARADGHNDAKRVALLEVTGTDRIEYFDIFHGLVFGPPKGKAYQLQVRLPNGTKAAREVAPITLADRRAQMAQRSDAADAVLWNWTMRPDGVAVLSMPSWALYDSKWDWQRWLDDRLDSLGGARGLVIDLRDNEGGQDCGNRILERLVTKAVPNEGAERRIRFRRTPATLDPHLDTWDNSFRTLGVDAKPLADGFFQLPASEGSDFVDPRGARIMLPVAALIGPVNSSATYQFAALAKRSGTVRLFGQTTGGNQRGINGGCFFFVRLPASGIEFDLPLIGYFPPGTPPDAGLTPDVSITPTIADIASGRDRVAEAAIAWVRSS